MKMAKHRLQVCSFKELKLPPIPTVQQYLAERDARLMEKSSLDTRRSRNMSWYDDTRTSYKHNADYLKRLSSLRDNLIDQEQTNLAQAIERLRAKQSNRDNFVNKQKFRQHFDLSDGNNKKFFTTLEKFKQRRPKKFPPELYPLEGKQLIEPQNGRSPHIPEVTASSPASVTRSTDENVVKSNLQRLIAPSTPTSSIPNLGRKSQKTTQQFILETSPIQRKKSCLSADHIDKNPFKNVRRGARARKNMRPTLEGLDLSPQAVKFEKMGDHDKLNIDKLKEYYCIYYLPSNTPTGQENLSDDDDEKSISAQSIEENRYFKSDENGEVRRFPSEEYRYKGGYFGASQRVPERKPMIHPITGKALVTNPEDIRKHRLRKLHISKGDDNSNFVNGGRESANKKQIIVDMPSIVFNAPTPEVTDVDLRATLLAKAYKQNELRQRELKNLLDDVKELNKMSDDLSENLTFQRPAM